MENKSVSVFKAQIELKSLLNTIPKSKALTCLFGTFVFLQFTVLALANHAGEGYFSTSQRELVYYALQVFVILGYLLYSLFDRFCPGKHIRNIVLYSVFGIFFGCTAMMLMSGYDSLRYVIISMAAALCLGGIGGTVHLRMSLETMKGTDTARCMGLGSAAAILLQYLLQIRTGLIPLLPFFMLTAFLLFLFILLRSYPETVIEEEKKPQMTPPGRIVISVLITAAFLFFTCFYNEYIHHLQIQSDYEPYNVYSWPRLMLIPVYLLFAVIGGKKSGKYVPLTSLCIMLFALLNVVLTGNPGMYWLNMCVFYCVIAAFTSYYLLTFWRLAPGTRHPALWAPMGRILDSAVVLAAGSIRLSSVPVPVILGVYIAGIAMIILLMTINGDFNLNGEPRTEPQPVPETVPPLSDVLPSASEIVSDISIEVPFLSPEETLMRMQDRYQLTSREADVLRELVLTEDKQAIISERLSIQVKTLQDYVTRLYRKTGAATRAGLTDLYHETRTRV